MAGVTLRDGHPLRAGHRFARRAWHGGRQRGGALGITDRNFPSRAVDSEYSETDYARAAVFPRNLALHERP